jgi:hypothetical protein
MLNLVESLGRQYFLETHHHSCFKHEGKFWYLKDVGVSTKAGKKEYKLVCVPIDALNGPTVSFSADILMNNKPFWETPLGLRALGCTRPGIGRRVTFLKGAFGLEKTIQAERLLPEIDTEGLTELLIPQYAIFREVLEAMENTEHRDFQAVLDKNTAFSYSVRYETGKLYINTGEKTIVVATINKQGAVIEGNETLAFSLINRDRYEPK